MGDLNVSPVISFNGAPGAHSFEMENVHIGRAPGAIPLGSIGLEIRNTSLAIIKGSYIFRHAIGISVIGVAAITFRNICTSVILDAHYVINIVQVGFDFCTFGRAGDADLSCNHLVRLTGITDTLTFNACQFNLTGPGGIRADSIVTRYPTTGTSACFQVNGTKMAHS